MIYIFLLVISLVATLKLRTWQIWFLVSIGVATLLVSYHPQHWGLFHYQIGSKYFQEVGYFDLYECAALADGHWFNPRRDLHTYLFIQEMPVCESFTEERWLEFRNDLMPDEAFGANMLRDKGLNATPTWIAIGERLAHLPQSFITMLDALAVVVALFITGRLLDWRKAGYAALFILVYYGAVSRLTGHFGQWWWLALVIVGIALIQRQKAIGGFLLGLSVTLAIFPAFLLMVRSKRILLWAVAGMFIGLIVGLTTSRGFSAYPEFIHNMMLHSPAIRYEPSNIGLFNSLSMASSPPETLQDWLTCFRGGHCQVEYHFESPWLLWLLLLPVVVITRLGAMFGLLTLSRYYYLIMATIPLEEAEYRTRVLFAMNVVLMTWTMFDREAAYQYGHFLWLAFFASYWFVPGHKPVEFVQRVFRKGVGHETQKQAHA